MASSLNTLTRRQAVEYDVIKEMHGIMKDRSLPQKWTVIAFPEGDFKCFYSLQLLIFLMFRFTCYKIVSAMNTHIPFI